MYAYFVKLCIPRLSDIFFYQIMMIIGKNVSLFYSRAEYNLFHSYEITASNK